MPLPVGPFKTTEWRVLCLFQQLAQPAEIRLFPGLLSHVHICRVKMALRGQLFRIRPDAFFLLGSLGALSFFLRRLGAWRCPLSAFRAFLVSNTCQVLTTVPIRRAAATAATAANAYRFRRNAFWNR